MMTQFLGELSIKADKSYSWNILVWRPSNVFKCYDLFQNVQRKVTFPKWKNGMFQEQMFKTFKPEQRSEILFPLH